MLRQSVAVVALAVVVPALANGEPPARGGKPSEKSKSAERAAAVAAAAAASDNPAAVRARPLFSLKEWRKVNAVIAAHARGNSVAALELLSPLLPQLNDKQLAALDEYFAERHTPPASQIITDAHLGMVFQGFSSKLHRPKARETLILVPEIHNAVPTTESC